MKSGLVAAEAVFETITDENLNSPTTGKSLEINPSLSMPQGYKT